MEQRMTPLAHLEEFMDSNEIIFRYNEKANRFSAIQADYLLQNDVEQIPVYVFLAQRTGHETYVCRTLFPKTGKSREPRRAMGFRGFRKWALNLWDVPAPPMKPGFLF